MIWTRPLWVSQVLDKFLERTNTEIIIVENDAEPFITQCSCFKKEFPREFKRCFVNYSFVWIDVPQRRKSEGPFQRVPRQVNPLPRKAFSDHGLIGMVEVDHSVVSTHCFYDVFGEWAKLLVTGAVD